MWALFSLLHPTEVPRDSLFASCHLGPMRTSPTPPKRMPAHSEQAPGSKKPFFIQAATPSSQTLLGWEPGLRCPAALPDAQVGARLPWRGWAGQGTAQRNPWQRARRACHLR